MNIEAGAIIFTFFSSKKNIRSSYQSNDDENSIFNTTTPTSHHIRWGKTKKNLVAAFYLLYDEDDDDYYEILWYVNRAQHEKSFFILMNLSIFLLIFSLNWAFHCRYFSFSLTIYWLPRKIFIHENGIAPNSMMMIMMNQCVCVCAFYHWWLNQYSIQ